MDLIFNELSFTDKADNEHSARCVMEKLLLCCKAAKEFIKDLSLKLRINDDFFAQELTDGYSVSAWLNDPVVSKNMKTLLLGLKRTPFIDENDEKIENKFIQNYYYLHAPELTTLHAQEVEGLAVAYLYSTLAVSLQTNDYWNETSIFLVERFDSNEKIVEVKHFNDHTRIEVHQGWLTSQIPVELIECAIAAENKQISLRDDHGKDILLTFSRKLIHSPYVEKVINSIPFNPNQKEFIKKILPDGKIEIVLTWTDQGLGCVIQTTGRNIQETYKIAEILNKKYGR